MKETLFYFKNNQIYCEKGNYPISLGELVRLKQENYYVLRIDHDFDTKYKVVILTDKK